jgi:polar amino acid transport system permease protein
MQYEFQWSVIWAYKGLLLEGVRVTLQLALIAFACSVLLSIVVAVARSSNRLWPRFIAGAFVEYFRNVPLVVHLFYLYFVVGLNSFNAGVIGLTLYSTAFISEVIRSGINAVPKTQLEAAYASGLKTPSVLRYITLPQALMFIIPPLATELINVLKNSAITMTIAVRELTFMSQEIDAITFRGFEATTVVTLIYVLLCLAILLVLYTVEHVVGIEKRVM